MPKLSYMAFVFVFIASGCDEFASSTRSSPLADSSASGPPPPVLIEEEAPDRPDETHEEVDSEPFRPAEMDEENDDLAGAEVEDSQPRYPSRAWSTSGGEIEGSFVRFTEKLAVEIQSQRETVVVPFNELIPSDRLHVVDLYGYAQLFDPESEDTQ